MLNKQRELYKNYLHLKMEKYYKVLKNLVKLAALAAKNKQTNVSNNLKLNV